MYFLGPLGSKGMLLIYTYLRLRQGCSNPASAKGCEWRAGGSYAVTSNLKFCLKESAAWKLCLRVHMGFL